MPSRVFDREKTTNRIDAIDLRPFLDGLFQQRRVRAGDPDIGEDNFEPAEASAIIATAIPPSARISAAVSSVLAARPTTNTAAPSRAKRIALARPMPLPPPVTIARRPSSRFMRFSYLAGTVQPPSAVMTAPWT
jgi:hypothetical protein